MTQFWYWHKKDFLCWFRYSWKWSMQWCWCGYQLVSTSIQWKWRIQWCWYGTNWCRLRYSWKWSMQWCWCGYQLVLTSGQLKVKHAVRCRYGYQSITCSRTADIHGRSWSTSSKTSRIPTAFHPAVRHSSMHVLTRTIRAVVLFSTYSVCCSERCVVSVALGKQREVQFTWMWRS